MFNNTSSITGYYCRSDTWVFHMWLLVTKHVTIFDICLSDDLIQTITQQCRENLTNVGRFATRCSSHVKYSLVGLRSKSHDRHETGSTLQHVMTGQVLGSSTCNQHAAHCTYIRCASNRLDKSFTIARITNYDAAGAKNVPSANTPLWEVFLSVGRSRFQIPSDTKQLSQHAH